MNIERFKQVLEKIRANPADWKQNSWGTSCGTPCCFAGHAARIARKDFCRFGRVPDDAQAWLEIDDYFACFLFACDTELEDFEEILRLAEEGHSDNYIMNEVWN